MRRLLPYLLFGLLGCLGTAMLFPTGSRSRESARRASCQSNEKQILLAVAQYAQDFDDHLPPRRWATALLPYVKEDSLFQCPSVQTKTARTSDYFWNARFTSAKRNSIKQPATSVLLGDGQDAAPLDATLSSFPETWRSDENSPAFRHLETANYGFADGHVKALKANRVTRDFHAGGFK